MANDPHLNGYKIVSIDEKWSIAYDPTLNDAPKYWLRYGERHSEFDENNAVLALFYAFLNKE